MYDRRGRNKPADELTELEKLGAENRLLKVQAKQQQMEIDFLKNSMPSRGGGAKAYQTSGHGPQTNPGYAYFPNEMVGWGKLCLKKSLPD